MTSPSQLLAWARLTHETFGMSMEEALQKANDWSQQANADERAASVHISILVARALSRADRVPIEERRQIVLDAVRQRAPTRQTAMSLTMATFQLLSISGDERDRIVKAVREDLGFWARSKVLQSDGMEFWCPAPSNGPIKEQWASSDLLRQ